VRSDERVERGVLADVLRHFDLGGAIADAAPAAEGHIHRSWVVTVGAARFLLQRLNEHVFPAPERVMENVDRVTRHLAAALAGEGAAEPARRALRLVHTREGLAFHRDAEGGAWRVYPFISGTSVREHVTTRAQARETGRAFGTFQRLLASYDGPPLHETIQCFHDTARRVQSLERAVSDDWASRVADAREEIAAALARRELAAVLPPLLASGAVPERIAHNDAKSSNVLLDERTGEALCVVDLDTVMPGSALHDFGDLVRSSTSPTAEDERDTGRIGARRDLFEGLAEGFLGAAGAILRPAERDLLVDAGRIITFEQAVRFLTDHLDGDRYYRTAYAGHNLVRCRAQLTLLKSLERQDAEFRAVIAGMDAT
jgi:hypothetical protein